MILNPGERMLMLLKVNPTLLPSAPDHADADHIEHRRRDEVHVCLRCGQRAASAFIAHFEPPATPKRWVDLCLSCTHWLREQLVGRTLCGEKTWPADDIRAAMESRPGQGARTDLQQKEPSHE